MFYFLIFSPSRRPKLGSICRDKIEITGPDTLYFTSTFTKVVFSQFSNVFSILFETHNVYTTADYLSQDLENS